MCIFLPMALSCLMLWEKSYDTGLYFEILVCRSVWVSFTVSLPVVVNLCFLIAPLDWSSTSYHAESMLIYPTSSPPTARFSGKWSKTLRYSNITSNSPKLWGKVPSSFRPNYKEVRKSTQVKNQNKLSSCPSLPKWNVLSKLVYSIYFSYSAY